MPAVDAIEGPVLVVAAHPDDIEVHCGGTLSQLAASGVAITCVLCTSGNRGTAARVISMGELAASREEEQRRASAALGIRDLRFLRYDDGDLQFCVAPLREQIVAAIREVRPRTVITHDPYPGDGGRDSCSIYPDHLTVGRVTFEAAFVCAPGPLFYPEQLERGLDPHKPELLYLIMSANADRFVDVTDCWETKLRALHHHETQGRHTSENDREMERIARENGERAGHRLAEAFRVLRPS
jgi:LmbE family N-acetylglucosaminyl deacetylase